MLSQKREQQSLFYTGLHKSAFKELDPVGEPDMRMSSDSGVKTETKSQRKHTTISKIKAMTYCFSQAPTL